MFPFRTVGLLAGNTMFIAWVDSRVCTAWLRCLVRIAHRSSRGGNYRLGRMGMTEGLTGWPVV